MNHTHKKSCDEPEADSEAQSLFSFILFIHVLHKRESWPRGCKIFSSAEHEIFSANEYENANNSWHFHIY